MLAAILFLSSHLLTGWVATQDAQKNVIKVDVQGLRSDKGQVLCALYSSGNGFPKDQGKAQAHSLSMATNRQGVCEFESMCRNILQTMSWNLTNVGLE